MKKDKKILLLIILVMCLISAGAAWWYLSSREDETDSSGDFGKSLVVVSSGNEKQVDISGLTTESFSGTTVNGKGETNEVSGQGVKLSSLIETEDYTEVTVTADDAYSAAVKKDEIDNAWLKIDGDSAGLIVFGDKDSKRNVRNVVRIEAK